MSGTLVLFSDEFGDRAAIYVHGDATDTQEILEEFFKVELSRIGVLANGTYSNRFDDPQYLAARFVAHMNTTTVGGTGVGVTVPSERYDDNLRVLCTQSTTPRVATL